MCRFIERTPTLGVRRSPERLLRVQPRQIPKSNADLPHGFEGAAHHVTEHFFQYGIDDRILKLRMLKTMCVTCLGEIIETDRQTHFTRLQLLASQLADKPCRFAQDECQ